MSDINYNQETINQFLADYNVKETGSRKKPYAYIERPWQRIERPWKRITRPWEPVERPWQNYKAPWTSTRYICPHMVKVPADDEGIGYRGHGWKIIRDGKEYAVACPGDKNDTIETLAEKLGLDAKESSKWLFDAYGEAVTNDDFTYRKAYTVPNTVILSIGQCGTFSDPADMPEKDVEMLMRFKEGLERDKFKVIDYSKWRNYKEQLKISLASHCVFGWVHSGHGGDNKISTWNKWYVYEAQVKRYHELVKHIADSSKRKKYAKKGYEAFEKNNIEQENNMLAAEDVRTLRPFTFSYLIFASCYINGSGKLTPLVTNDGIKILPTGKAYPSDYKYIQPKGVR